MARASTRKTEQPQPDVSVVTDGNAEAAEAADAGSTPAEAGDAGQSGSSGADGTRAQADASKAVDAGGSVLVEVVADGATFRVGGHPLLLLRGTRAKVSADVADRGEQRGMLRRV